MKKVAVFFNSPYLGGAERSIIHQMELISPLSDLSYFIPFLENKKEGDEIEKLLASFQKEKSSLVYLHYPAKIYSLSRDRIGLRFIPAFLSFLQYCLSDGLDKGLRRYDILWLNGNKIALLVLVKAFLSGYRGKIVWHFRDYPSYRSILKIIAKLYNKFSHGKLLFVGNSNSVKKELDLINGNKDTFRVYNTVGASFTESEKKKDSKIIGVVAMLAPWKGIHQLIIFASLFEQKIMDLGVSEIRIYGGAIYQTSGAHLGYKAQLESLLKKFPSRLISFQGICPPEKIFQEIDCLVHSSISPEPFGRVLIEAFRAKVPVVSTGLGGASELVNNEKFARTFNVYDYQGLFEQVKYSLNDKLVKSQIEAAYTFSLSLKTDVYKQLQAVLDA